MYLNLLRQLCVLCGIFAPLILLGCGHYNGDAVLMLIGTVWYCINLILSLVGLLYMTLNYIMIKTHIRKLQSLTDITAIDLKDQQIPKDIQPILYSTNSYYFMGIINLIMLVYTQQYVLLGLYIICLVWFVDLIDRFNRAAVVCNREFARCKAIKAGG